MMSNKFIGCDWGTTTFRVRLVERGTRRVLAERSLAAGVKTFSGLPPDARKARMTAFLTEQISSLPDTAPDVPVIITGMASSNIGWYELPYAEAAFPLDSHTVVTKSFRLPGKSGGSSKGLLISGVRTSDDVMRGEECALIGLHALHPEVTNGLQPVTCLLAGTHPKHGLVSAGKLVSFCTYLTGELFEVLVRDSLLATSVVQLAKDEQPDWDDFRAGVACAGNRGLEAALFQVRARHILIKTTPIANTWFLSGLLVGGELRNIQRGDVVPALCIIGDELRAKLYREALLTLKLSGPKETILTVPLPDAIVAGQEQILKTHETLLLT